MAELLLELLSEEIPARMQARAAADLKRLIGASLETDGLKFSRIETYSTPRRLTLFVDGLPVTKPAIKEEKRGPRSDAPVEAITGFVRANRISKEDLMIRSTEKGQFYFAVVKTPEQITSDLVPLIVETALFNLSWPKSMRWGYSAMTWVRPIQNILVIFDGKPVNASIQLGTRYKIPGLNAGIPLEPNEREIRFVSRTTGHRFMAPKPFNVRGFADYKAKLRQAHVILDPEERRAEILKQAKRKAARAGLALRDDPALLDEVTGLVEWPVVLIGTIDRAFMDLPPEVLTSTMRTQQKFLALLDPTSMLVGLANRFLVVANMETPDKGKAIVAGNERVLRARLADARFFWDQDRKVPLASRTPRLREITFHEKLGTLDEKVDRVQALASEIADYVPGADKDRVRSAARLAKADLVTGMVGEFPELQGIIGRYYALHDGEHADVADAIAEHYAPQGPNDACPSAPVSVAVALADKIDTLVGFFAIGETPTGSKDPYALRRAALGVIRLIVENGLRVPLRKVIAQSHFVYDESARAAHGRADADSVAAQLLDFFAERLKVALREKGVRHDLISAVFALGGEDDLVRLLARVAALDEFLHTEDGADLLVAYQRAANIVRIEEKRDGTTYDGPVSPNALAQPEEGALFEALGDAEEKSNQSLRKEDFAGAMAALAGLRRPVDAFFDHVTVNTEDPVLRANRLRLLSRIRATLDRVADFSKIEG